MFAYRRTVRTGTPVFSAIFAYGTGQTEWREAKIFIARLFRYAQYGSPSRLSAVVTRGQAPLSPPIRRSAWAIEPVETFHETSLLARYAQASFCAMMPKSPPPTSMSAGQRDLGFLLTLEFVSSMILIVMAIDNGTMIPLARMERGCPQSGRGRGHQTHAQEENGGIGTNNHFA